MMQPGLPSRPSENSLAKLHGPLGAYFNRGISRDGFIKHRARKRKFRDPNESVSFRCDRDVIL